MMRKISFRVGVFFMCMLLVLSPSVALGEDRELDGGVGVGWAGEVEGGNYAVHARALNKYYAACWAMGVNPLTISTANRSKLSDPNYGGDFYVYAQSFTNIIGWDDVPGWMPTYATLTFVLYGFDNQWASEVSKSLYDSAKVDFKHVLAGEDVGGGGSGLVDLHGYASFPMDAWDNDRIADADRFSSNAINCDIVDGYIVPTGGTTKCNGYLGASGYCANAVIYYDSAVAEFVNQLVSDGYKVILATNNIYYSTDLNKSYGIYGAASRAYFISSSSTLYSVDVPVLANRYYDGRLLMIYGSIGTTSVISSKKIANQWSSSVITSPLSVPGPDGDWPEPDTPVTPDPPEIPTPTAPTVTPDPEPTQPTPTWPDITINIPAAPTVEVTPTGLDYTELLTRINDNLNTINSYTVSINSGLNSLRSDLVTEFESVEQALRNIYQFLQHLDSMLERHCQHLRDALSDCTHHLELYLKELFEWLPQQLNYDAQFEYDDSAVTSLLQRILNKIPGGSTSAPTTYKPNPQADEPGFFDWLTDLWHRFLIDLVSVLPDEIGGLVDAFSQLTHYFPFSIPWDLAAMLALFEHEPVTPVFDVPWGFGGNEGDVEMVRVDLSPWDGVMQMVRPVFVVGFCWQLALITKDLLAGFDLNKGGV